MTERDIFLAAIDLTDPTERAKYIEKACAGDDALRAKVQALLQSHDAPGSFLGKPAVPAGNADPDATLTNVDGRTANLNEEQLSFLSPPERPDSLGRLGHYEILQVLGRGAFGIVFRAFDDVLQRVVAVKVLAPQVAMTSPARKRFLREAQSSAQVRHENVVQVYEVGEKPLPYLVMEFIPGETLQQRLDRTGPLDVAESLRIGRQIAEGLAAAHSTDLIHRDIKPGNILLEGGQQKVKITDFGLARAADDASISQSGLIAGTPMYMAPEQAQGQTLDQRADLFSLGSVLYQIVSGRPPFRANSTVAVLKRVAEDTPRDIRELIPETPQWLCNIIAKLHAKNPDDRYQSAREVADVLADCEAQLKASSKLKDFSRIPKSKLVPVSRRPRRRARLAMAMALVLVVTLGGLWVAKKGVGNVYRYVMDESTVEVATMWDSSVEKVIVKRDGEPIETITSGATRVNLAPGRYELEIVARPGYQPANVIYDVNGMGPTGTWSVAARDGHYSLMLYRGESFRVFITSENVVPISEPGFVSLFNGKDVPGTKTSEGRPDSWQVKDHVLVGSGDAGRMLRKDLQDFQCRIEAKVVVPGMANVDFRTAWSPVMISGQAVLESRVIRNRTGGLALYMEPKAGQLLVPSPNPPASPDGWFTLEIIAKGKKVTIKVDGTTTAERTIPELPDRGDLVLSIVDKGAVIHFRKIEIKELPPSGPAMPPSFKNALGMEFVLVPKGKSWLGGGSGVVGEHGVELVREVEIAQDFYLGKYEVTQEEWQKVMGRNPSSFVRTGAGKDSVKDVADADLARFPVESVSWDDCQEFINRLNESSKESGWVYRLPTPSEWEYACRGGPLADRLDSTFDFYCEKPTNQLHADQANIVGKGRTCKVGSYKPNQLGLYDMHGNVWEWCEDIFDANDPALASLRAIRGGCWVDGAENCRAAVRHGTPQSLRSHYFGLRLARVPSGAPSPDAKTPPQDPDRRAAEYVLSLGGMVKVNEQEQDIKAKANLPHEPFRLTSVDLGFTVHGADDGLASFKGCTNLVHLGLNANPLFNSNPYTDEGLAYFKDCKNLTSLALSSSGVTDLGLLHFKECKNLTVLSLSNTGITDAGLARVRGFNDLTQLHLGNTGVTDGGLVHFKGYTKLTHLRLPSGVTDAGLVYFKDCKNLIDLDLSRTLVSDAGIAVFMDWKNLRVLSLYNTQVGDVGLAQLKDCKELRVLDFAGTRVTDAGLSSLKNFKDLTYLALWDTLVSDAGLAHIAGLDKLTDLHLAKTRVTAQGVMGLAKILPKCVIRWDGGVIDPNFGSDRRAAEFVLSIGGVVGIDPGGEIKALAKLPKSVFRLTRVDLVNNWEVRDPGLQDFKNCEKLNVLDLTGTRVTDEGLGHLAGLSELRNLRLTKTRVTAKGVEGLAKALPKCKITWDSGVIEPK